MHMSLRSCCRVVFRALTCWPDGPQLSFLVMALGHIQLHKTGTRKTFLLEVMQLLCDTDHLTHWLSVSSQKYRLANLFFICHNAIKAHCWYSVRVIYSVTTHHTGLTVSEPFIQCLLLKHFYQSFRSLFQLHYWYNEDTFKWPVSTQMPCINVSAIIFGWKKSGKSTIWCFSTMNYTVLVRKPAIVIYIIPSIFWYLRIY